MAIQLGLDIGASTIKLAALGAAGDRGVLARLCRKRAGFRLVEAGGPLALSPVVPAGGAPIQAVFELLRGFYEIVPEARVEGFRVTGSGSRGLAKILGVYFEDEIRAVARALSVLYPGTRTVFEIGAESSRYFLLEPDGDLLQVVDYARSGECAAGTGSFIEQQALRLGYGVDEVGAVVAEARRAAHVAGRCSVFAKSDMIHAQQKGFAPAEILRGLCDAVARNFKGNVARSKTVRPPVALLGGVALNGGLVAALRAAFELDEHELFVPELFAWCGAIGAAVLESLEAKKRSFRDIHLLAQHSQERAAGETTPLSLEGVVALREALAPRAVTAPVDCYVGLDIGSVSTNVVAIDGDGAVIRSIYLRTAGRPLEAVSRGLAQLRAEFDGRLRVRGAGTTGSGRELAAEVVGADVVKDEITAHKTGALHVARLLDHPPVETIFEIGGQDSKFIALENGVVTDFAMNEACAAGTGSFLEEQAEKLQVRIDGEFARLALASRAPSRLGERCTVFMERELSTRLQAGETVPNLVAGLAYSIALNYLNRVVRGRPVGRVIYFLGGTAYNDAVAAAFASLLDRPVIVPPYHGVMGALGMALMARAWHQTTGEETRFRGAALERLAISTRSFACKGCANECDIKEYTVEGTRSYWGDQCSDRFRKPARNGARPVIDDLIALREAWLAEFEEEAGRAEGGPAIGLPRAMSMYDHYPFWSTYFRTLGLRTMLSPATTGRTAARGFELAVAQPCFPIQVAHGHAAALLEAGAEYLFVPNLLDAESMDPAVPAHYCPWNQTLPYVLRSAPAFEGEAWRFLAPSIHFQMGRQQVRAALAECVRRFGILAVESHRAVDAAYAAQRTFQERLLAAGRRALRQLEQAGAPALVLAGRGYNLYDRAVNCDVPRKLRQRYGANVIPYDFLVTGAEDVAALHANMYWISGQRILAAAGLVRARRDLHLIYLTNFKCGPDSYIKHFCRQTCDAPMLVLQFDGHGNDAGYMTRCEAYLDSKGLMPCQIRPGPEPAAALRR